MSPDDKFDRDMAELEADLDAGHIDYEIVCTPVDRVYKWFKIFNDTDNIWYWIMKMKIK